MVHIYHRDPRVVLLAPLELASTEEGEFGFIEQALLVLTDEIALTADRVMINVHISVQVSPTVEMFEPVLRLLQEALSTDWTVRLSTRDDHLDRIVIDGETQSDFEIMHDIGAKGRRRAAAFMTASCYFTFSRV